MRAVMPTLALVVLGLLSPLARAGTPCLECSCSVSVLPISFGEYNPLSPPPTDSTGSVTVRCSYGGGGAPPKLDVTIGLGSGNSGDAAQRRLRAGPYALAYNLYRDSGRSTVWTDVGTSGEVTVNVKDTGWTDGVVTTIYARMPGRQAATPGTYTDIITVTVSY